MARDDRKGSRRQHGGVGSRGERGEAGSRRQHGEEGSRRQRVDDEILPAESMEQLETRSDALIDLVGAVERRHPAGAAFDDPRFLHWLETQGAGVVDDGELLDAREIAAAARDVLAALAGDEHGVRCVAARAPSMPVRDIGSVSAAVELLAPRRQVAMHDLGVAAGVGCELWDAECEAVIPLPDELPTGRYLALRVKGESMLPLMHPGDVVLVELGEQLVRDRVIVARGPEEGYVVKRVGRVTPRAIELLSLNPAFAPVTIARDPNPVLGTVVLRWCEHQ